MSICDIILLERKTRSEERQMPYFALSIMSFVPRGSYVDENKEEILFSPSSTTVSLRQSEVQCVRVAETKRVFDEYLLQIFAVLQSLLATILKIVRSEWNMKIITKYIALFIQCSL